MDHSDFDGLKLSNQLCFPLYAASRKVVNLYRPYLDELDLTYTQYITMMVIWECKTLSVKEIGQRLLLDSGTLTPVLKSLESKGFVTRRRSSDDERVLMIDITKKGEVLKTQVLSVRENVGSCLPLNSEEALQLYSLLYKLLAALNED